jgi:rRNA-processing protein FCF1
MTHLLLDTNAFTADRRREAGPFRALVRLCKGQKVKLHVPYVVKNEFVSQQKQEGRKLLKELRNLAHELHSVTLDEEISALQRIQRGQQMNSGKKPVICSNRSGALAERSWS